ncbi:unnamed protein product [Caretta caretta]
MGLVLRELELRLVLSAYADDVLLVVQDPGDLAQVEACQTIYSAASSARVNWVKSSGLAVGDWQQLNGGPPRFLLDLRHYLGNSTYLDDHGPPPRKVSSFHPYQLLSYCIFWAKLYSVPP